MRDGGQQSGGPGGPAGGGVQASGRSGRAWLGGRLAERPARAKGALLVLRCSAACCRQLSQDAKKSEGGLASFFSAADHPEVKEAAERAVLKVRSLAEAPDALEQIRAAKVCERRARVQQRRRGPALAQHSCGESLKWSLLWDQARLPRCLPLQELLRPLQLACDTKSPKLVGHALSTAQKMLANGAMSPEGTLAVVGLLAKVRSFGGQGGRRRCSTAPTDGRQRACAGRWQLVMAAAWVMCMHGLSCIKAPPPPRPARKPPPPHTPGGEERR